MPGKTAHAARKAFLEPLKRSLSCVTNAQLFTSTGSYDEPHVLTLSEDPLRLRSRSIGDLQLKLVHRFKYVQKEPTYWHVSTLAYYYRLSDGAGQELVSWHWHPETRVDYPHLHMSNSAIDRRVHLPTGRVSIESIFRLLLTDLQVPPQRAHAHDYLQVLDESEGPFLQYRRWHGRPNQ